MYQLNPKIEIENIGDEIIVIDSQDGRFLEMNQMAHIILCNLLEGVSIEDISKELSLAYDKTFEVSMAIVVDYINSLKELEILRSDE
jgi:hypothetical protein